MQAGPSSQKGSRPARTKLVIRHLPPNLPEELLWKTIEPWVNEKTCVWKRYAPGSISQGPDKAITLSRAYVLLADEHLVKEFHLHFHGHVFRSKKGEEFQALVETAPVQKTPHGLKVKPDNRQGTIDDDPVYKAFLDSHGVLDPISSSNVVVSTEHHAAPKSTPLLDYLRESKSKSKGSPKSDPSGGSRKSKESTSSEPKTKKHKSPKQKGRDKGEKSDQSGGKAAKGDQLGRIDAVDTESAALASVNAAAAHRAPPDQGGVKMVAGKGREVTVTAAAKSEGEGSKRKKPPRKVANENSGAAKDGLSGKPPAETTKTPQSERSTVQDGASDTGHRGGKTGERGGGGRGRGRGRGRGGGGGAGEGRSAHGAVVEILSRNAEGERGKPRRGRGGGAGRGGAAGSGETGPTMASSETT